MTSQMAGCKKLQGLLVPFFHISFVHLYFFLCATLSNCLQLKHPYQTSEEDTEVHIVIENLFNRRTTSQKPQHTSSAKSRAKFYFDATTKSLRKLMKTFFAAYETG